MSTPGNDPQNPQTPNGEPNAPQYGQRAPQDPNAAGQPPYGQPPQYGSQEPNPYGQPPQAGGFQVPPQGNFAAPQMPTHRPKELDTSFWAILAAGVVAAVAMITSIFGLNAASLRAELASMEGMEEQLANSGMNLDDVMGMLPTIQTVVVVIAVISLAIYALIAFMIRKGSNVARIFATIFAALSLLSLGTGLLMLVAIILGVVGVVFAWLRPSSQFIAARRAARAAGYR